VTRRRVDDDALGAVLDPVVVEIDGVDADVHETVSDSDDDAGDGRVRVLIRPPHGDVVHAPDPPAREVADGTPDQASERDQLAGGAPGGVSLQAGPQSRPGVDVGPPGARAPLVLQLGQPHDAPLPDPTSRIPMLLAVISPAA